MSDGSIVTGIDNLLKYLKEHGETDSITLAASLNVSEKTIEDWSNVLEKAKMIHISYKLGKMYASPVLISEAAVGEEKRLTDIKKSIIERDIETQITATEELGTKIVEYSKFVSSADNIFKTKAGALKEAVDRVYKLQDEIAGRYNRIKESKEAVEKLAVETEERLKGLQSQEEEIKNFNLSTGSAQAVIDDIKSKIYASDESIKDLILRFDKETLAERKRLSSLAESIKAESKSLAEIAAGEERQLSEYESMAGQYKRSLVMTKKSLERQRQGLLDSVFKTRGEVARMYDSAEKEIKKLGEELEKSKKTYGGFASLSERLNEIRKGVAELSKEREVLGKELEEMLKQLKEAEGIDVKKLNEKKNAIDSIEKRTKVTSKRLEKATRNRRSLREKIDNIAK